MSPTRHPGLTRFVTSYPADRHFLITWADITMTPEEPAVNLLRKPGAIVVAALALAVLPGAASAHDGDHPFENCTEAYAAGHANIPAGDEHYGSHLDRDGDGIACDRPPADFRAHDDEAAAAAEDTGKKGTDLAETGGGGDTTVYLAAAGSAVLLTGGALVASTRRRRAAR
jgi:hypothetical protein